MLEQPCSSLRPQKLSCLLSTKRLQSSSQAWTSSTFPSQHTRSSRRMRRSEHSICDRACSRLAMHSLAYEKYHMRPLSNHDPMGTTAAHQLADTCSATTDQSKTSLASYMNFITILFLCINLLIVCLIDCRMWTSWRRCGVPLLSGSSCTMGGKMADLVT